jgi:hypothetical protein
MVAVEIPLEPCEVVYRAGKPSVMSFCGFVTQSALSDLFDLTCTVNVDEETSYHEMSICVKLVPAQFVDISQGVPFSVSVTLW